MGNEPAGVELLAHDEAQERRGRVGDESGGDDDVSTPELLEVQVAGSLAAKTMNTAELTKNRSRRPYP